MYNPKDLLYGILILGMLGLSPSSKGVLGQENKNMEGSCSNTLETVIDLALIRLAPKLSQIPIPNVSTSGIKFSSLTITGLDSIKRNCALSLILDKDSKDLTIKLCVNVGQVTLMGMAKLTFLGRSLDNIIKISLNDIQIQANITAPLKSGGPVHVNYFKIESIKKINVDTEGLLSAFGGVVNALIKTKVKDLILNILNKKLPGILNEELKKHPI